MGISAAGGSASTWPSKGREGGPEGEGGQRGGGAGGKGGGGWAPMGVGGFGPVLTFS